MSLYGLKIKEFILHRMVTTIAQECLKLVETWRITTFSVTCIWLEQGESNILVCINESISYTLSFYSSEVYRLNLEQGKFLSSLKTLSE